MKFSFAGLPSIHPSPGKFPSIIWASTILRHSQPQMWAVYVLENVLEIMLKRSKNKWNYFWQYILLSSIHSKFYFNMQPMEKSLRDFLSFCFCSRTLKLGVCFTLLAHFIFTGHTSVLDSYMWLSVTVLDSAGFCLRRICFLRDAPKLNLFSALIKSYHIGRYYFFPC
jgi:hypothetical protein